MKTKRDIIYKALFYCIVAFSVNYLASAVAFVCMEKLVSLLISTFKMTTVVINSISMLAVTVLILFLVLAATFIFIRVVLPPLYDEDEKGLWFKSSAIIIMPGELARYLFALTDLGFVDGSGKFAMIPSCLFELLYLSEPERHLMIRQYGEYNFKDYFFYTLCYLLYLAVYLTLAFLICKKVWNKYGKDYQDL